MLAASTTAVAQLDLIDVAAAGGGREIDPGWLPAGVILDFDPTGLVRTGLDASDDLAFLATLGANDRVRLLGLTLTYGNSILAHTRADARRLVKLAGVDDMDVPTVSGADWTSSHAFETTRNNAARFIIDTVNQYPPHTITLLCLGPLTNIAAALTQDPMLAFRLRAIVLSGGSRNNPSALGHWDLNLIMGDRRATSVVLAAEVPRVLVPREACQAAPMTPKLLEAVKQQCPGSAGCEYLAALQHASQRGASGRDWLADAWDSVFGDSDKADTNAWIQSDEDKQDSYVGGGAADPKRSVSQETERAPSSRFRQKASRAAAAGGGLCDLIAVSAYLAPSGFREWDVMAVEVSGWGMQWEVVKMGFSARQAQSILGSARLSLEDLAGGSGSDGEAEGGAPLRVAAVLPPDLQPLVVDWQAVAQESARQAERAANAANGHTNTDEQSQSEEEEAQELWPYMGPASLNGRSLTDEGVVLVPSLPETYVDELTKRHDAANAAFPAPIVHALALAFRVPHGEPYNEMKGSYVDDGFLNPYLMGPIIFVAASVMCAGITLAAVCLRTQLGWCRPKHPRVASKDE
jgi:inosine-uridine nucleoside N-ribohydrolase